MLDWCYMCKCSEEIVDYRPIAIESWILVFGLQFSGLCHIVLWICQLPVRVSLVVFGI